VLFVAGVVITFLAAQLTLQGMATQEPEMPGLGPLVTLLGVLLAGAGIAHLVSGVYVAAHRSWARKLGLVLSAAGTIVGVIATVGLAGQDKPVVVGLAVLVPYGFTLASLTVGSDHFRHRRQ